MTSVLKIFAHFARNGHQAPPPHITNRVYTHDCLWTDTTTRDSTAMTMAMLFSTIASCTL